MSACKICGKSLEDGSRSRNEIHNGCLHRLAEAVLKMPHGAQIMRTNDGKWWAGTGPIPCQGNTLVEVMQKAGLLE